jgi:photosystem II stability/assembly factor-like uncharacterized protein
VRLNPIRRYVYLPPQPSCCRPAATPNCEHILSRLRRAAADRRTVPASRILALVATCATAGGAQAQDVLPSTPLLRQQYFDGQRAYPFARPPANALQRAFLAAQARWPAGFLPAARAAAIEGDPDFWQPIGPGTIEGRDAGRISTIALHPIDPLTIYIGAAQGGVWRTRDGGGHWVPLTDGECSLAMGSIALDPVDPAIVYAGTGELHFSGDSYYGCGLLRSLDAGDTWTRLGGELFDSDEGGARIARVIVDAASAGSATATTLYIASSLGVHRSDDSGASWRLLLDGTATDLVVSPADPRVLYAALGLPGGHASNGVYRTTDGGATWARLTTGFATAEVGRIALALAPSAPGTLYAAVQDAFGGSGDNGRLLGVWKTTDGGTTWARLPDSNLSCNNQCWYDLVVAVHPTDANTVYFGGVPLFRSRDGGDRFVNVLRNMHVDQHAIVFDPRDPETIYVGNDGGIYRTTNGAATWEPLNTNLAITQFYAGIAPHPYDHNAVIGGTQDNGTLEYGGVPSWISVLGADGGFAAVDHEDPTIAYAETQWTPGSGFAGPRRRDMAGTFTTRKVNGINTADRALFIPPLVMDPVQSEVLYFGTYRLYRTADRAENWSMVSGDLTRTAVGDISAVAPAPSDPLTVWVGTNDAHVQVTHDGGTTWNVRTAGLPARVVTDIAVDHRDARVAILSVSGFGTPHVFRTTDGGVTWNAIDAGLPDVPVNAVLVHPAIGDDVYIGTDLGVFRSPDGGVRWEPFNPGLPNVAVFDLAYSNETGRILAATHGRGVFAFAPPIAASVTAAVEAVVADALGDTIRVAIEAVDPSGVPIVAPALTWRSLAPDVVAADAAGRLTTRAPGVARIAASIGGRSDTVVVTVDPVPVAVVGLPDSVSLVVGETRAFTAAVVDRLGSALAEPVLWSSSDARVVTVDAEGTVQALAVGDATVRATGAAASFGDTVKVHVGPPTVLALAVEPAVTTGAGASSRVGARLPLLRLSARAEGPEAVRVEQLAFALSGDDAAASVELVLDENGDGAATPDEPVLASAAARLTAAAPITVALEPADLTVAAGDSVALLIVLRLSGAAPHGSTFAARFLPAGTRTRNVLSGVADRLSQPAGPVDSGPVATTVLEEGAALSLSENPVRSDRVVFNFRTVPTRVGIYTATGRQVIDLTARAGPSIVWDLTNRDGAPVAPGVYLVVFVVDGTVYREKLLVLRRSEPSGA